ncbi:MCE family protein [Mycobacterium sp. pUA109]|uniref:MlaD family protein n=1 Tax=Mycobacterium sp. pUA109 TaxID=3238982 RepID=UPI00351BC877
MARQFEFDGRGLSTPKLLAMGAAFLLVCALLGWLLLAKSQGKLDPRVQVTALLSSVGDGLPRKSDVKFRGVLVGAVREVTPAMNNQPNVVELDIKPGRARGIPNTVTARIVPSNAFAVSTVQLVDHGPAAPLRSGNVIAEDTTLPTQLFQTTLIKLRELVAAVTRPGNDQTLGLIRVLADATAGQGPALDSAAQGLNRIVAEMNDLSAEQTGPPTLKTWESAIAALRGTAPELLDSLHSAVVPMQTVAEKQVALQNLLTGAHGTVGTVRTAMDNHTDQLLAISTQLTPVVGVLTDSSAKFPAIALGLNNLVNTFFDELWTRTGNKLAFTFKLVVALAPLRLYTRADCPVYGELRGPSCDTAPETTPVVDTHGLPDARAYIPPPGTTLPAPGAELPAPGGELPTPTNPADQILLGPTGNPPPAETFEPSPTAPPAGTP